MSYEHGEDCSSAHPGDPGRRVSARSAGSSALSPDARPRRAGSPGCPRVLLECRLDFLV